MTDDKVKTTFYDSNGKVTLQEHLACAEESLSPEGRKTYKIARYTQKRATGFLYDPIEGTFISRIGPGSMVDRRQASAEAFESYMIYLRTKRLSDLRRAERL